MEIINALSKWREERGLKVEDQRANFETNFREEMIEFVQATSEHDKIDALADMCIIAINAGFEYDYQTPESADEFDDLLNADISAVLEWFKSGEQNKAFEWINSQAILIGYDLDECILEAIKEISSRTGAWDDTVGKWVKDTSPEAQAKWYKADYSGCKLN